MANLLVALSHLRGIGTLGKRQALDHMYTVYYLYVEALLVIFIGRSVLLNDKYLFSFAHRRSHVVFSLIHRR